MGYHHWLALNFLQASDIMDIPEDYQDTIHSQKKMLTIPSLSILHNFINLEVQLLKIDVVAKSKRNTD